MHEPWERLRIELEGAPDAGEDVVVEYRFLAEGGTSGASVDVRFFNALRLREGLVSRMAARRTLEDALEAARRR